MHCCILATYVAVLLITAIISITADFFGAFGIGKKLIMQSIENFFGCVFMAFLLTPILGFVILSIVMFFYISIFGG